MSTVNSTAHGITRTGPCKARREHRFAANEEHGAEEVARKVFEVRRDWMAVGAAWQDSHEACETCDFNVVNGEAPEFDSDCTLGQLGEQAHQCPALRADNAAAMRTELQAMADVIAARAPLFPATPHRAEWNEWVLSATTPAAMAEYVAALKSHDWHYQRADDNASYRAGEAERAALRAMQKRIDPDCAVWKQHSKEAA